MQGVRGSNPLGSIDTIVRTIKFFTNLKLNKSFVSIFALSLTSFIGTSTFFFILSPVALQRSLSIKSVDKIDKIKLFNNSYNSYSINEISNQIKSIPYQLNNKMVYAINPKEKLKKTIVEGDGNCSNLSFGSSIYSLYNKKKSVPIKLFTNEGFLKGSGHTVQLMSLQKKNIIVDFLEGGVPLKCGEPFQLKGLYDQGECELGFKVISSIKDKENFYFTEKELNKYFIGIHSQLEIDNYHKFIEKIYFPLFNKKLEKIFFDSISIVSGFYPKTYVKSVQWKRLFEDKKYLIIISKIWLYSFWLTFLGFIYLLFFRKHGIMIKNLLIKNNKIIKYK